jgi:hypothetical protein
MAKYTHHNGQTIQTEGTRYTITSANGNVTQTADLSNWTDNAEKWIDNDIKAGLYDGYTKEEEGNK